MYENLRDNKPVILVLLDYFSISSRRILFAARSEVQNQQRRHVEDEHEENAGPPRNASNRILSLTNVTHRLFYDMGK